eukprot:GHVR01184610.1.p1 GENE.GHVR01184610.1~~GHVR01184610.1.p1  ORF type:complete len:286 (-),score=39.06 GHVR01184610.1:564-1301(-)
MTRKIADPTVSVLEENLNDLIHCATDNKLNEITEDQTEVITSFTEIKQKEIRRSRRRGRRRRKTESDEVSEGALNERETKLKDTECKLEAIEQKLLEKEEECVTRLQNVSMLEEEVKKCNLKLTASDEKLQDSVKKCEDKDKKLIECERTTNKLKEIIKARDEVGVAKLCKACFEGSIAVVKCLLDTGVAVDCKNSEGRTPLFMASWKGCTGVVRFLLKKGGNFNERDKVRISLFISLLNSIRQE